MAKNDFRGAQGGGLAVFLEMAVYPMRCVLTMTDICEYDVEAFFVDCRIAREREALRYDGDDGRVDLRTAVIRDGGLLDEFVHDHGL